MRVGRSVPRRGVSDRLLRTHAGSRRAAACRSAEDDLHRAGAQALPGVLSRHSARSHHGGFHVYGRQPAARRLVVVYVRYL